MIKMKQALVAVAALSLCAAASATVSASATNLVNNGSFETRDFAGWNLAGNTGYTGVSSNFDGVAATDGNFQASFGAIGSDTVLSQQLTVSATGLYTVSFDLDDLTGSGAQDFSAHFGGATLVAFTSQPFATYTHESFTVAGGNGVLEFDARNDPTYWLLDNVSVTAAASAVPEASSTAMLMAGLGLLGFAAARRRQPR